MHKIIWYVQSLRFVAFFVSLIAFLCHTAQCILLSKYQEKNGIPGWLVAGHWQYLLWFITLGLSLAGGLVVCLSACYFNRLREYSFDRRIAALAISPIIVSLITAMSFGSSEPWTNGSVKVERSLGSLLSSCALFDAAHDKFYPLLYQRCLLNDWTWILAILLCIFWSTLVGIAMFALSKGKREETAKNATTKALPTTSQQRRRGEEPKWGRYIPDRPASIYSVTTLGNRSGLITPTSIKYGNSCYYYGDNSSIPSIPSPSDYYYSSQKKGGSYDKKSNDDDYHYTNDYYYNGNNKKSSYYTDKPSSTASNNNYDASSEYKSSPTTTTIGNYFTSKDYKSSSTSPTSIGDYFTSSEYKSSATANTLSSNRYYNSNNTRSCRSPSVSSSTYYNSTIAPSEYNYDHDYSSKSSPTHHNSLHSRDNEDTAAVVDEPVRTPLYNSFANKSKNTRFTLR